MKVRKYIKGIVKIAAALLLAVVVGLPWGTVAPARVSAEEYQETVNTFDNTYVIDDLTEDYVAKYPAIAGAEPQLQSFVEYCYSDNAFTRNASYGLYLYVYNPAQTVYSVKTGASVVNMAVAYNEAGEPIEYANLPLKTCGYTTGKYDKLFYKFRIMGVEKLLNNAVANDEAGKERRYDIAGIQLLSGNAYDAVDYGVSKTFYCSGYSKGCSKNSENESTLSIRRDDLETLHLKVHPTTYRPEGNNGKNAYTQDSLHSVWFSVPNEKTDKYGDLYSVHATWLDAVLKPALVTGNKDAYEAIKPYLGKDIGDQIDELDYAYLGGIYETDTLNMFYHCHLSYNAADDMVFVPLGPGYLPFNMHSSEKLSTLYLMFPAPDGANSADDYIVSPTDIEAAALNSKNAYAGPVVNGKYSSEIFSSVAEDFTEVEYSKDHIFGETEGLPGLTSNVYCDRSFWDDLFGRENEIESTEFSKVQAVQKITAEDLEGTAEEVCNKLYISTTDYNDLMNDYSAAENSGESLYLFRYQVTDYVAYEATLFERDSSLGTTEWDKVDTNARFFYETVNLSFEIIDVGLKKGEKITIIPVVMDPIDIFPESTPALDTTTDNPSGCAGFSWWYVVGLVLLLVFFKPICKFLWYVISFQWLGDLFNRRE